MRTLCILIALFSGDLLAYAAKAPSRPKYEVVGYLFGRGETLDGATLAAGKMTRINYAFFGLKDDAVVEGGATDAANLAVLTGLRRENPQLQILVSVGGGDRGSAGFSDMAITAEGRQRFVDSAMATVKRYGLDGVDVDWEYPGYTNNEGARVRPEDRESYTLLLRALRERFDAEEGTVGRPLVTSSATGATQIWLDHTEMREASRWLTTVNLMCYDWYNAVEQTTGHDSPLYTVAADPKQISIDEAVRKNLAAGVPARKLVVGVPFYGRQWDGVEGTNHGLWQPIAGKGADVEFGAVEPLIGRQGFVRYWDGRAAAPYLYNAGSHTFITYNDAETEEARATYVRRHHLGGMMFWEYSGDPRQTLLNAIDRGLGIGVR